jgi:hypothetical protein
VVVGVVVWLVAVYVRPRRVWRVQGWRRSGRRMGELAAAVREGRIDRRGTVILPADDRR